VAGEQVRIARLHTRRDVPSEWPGRRGWRQPGRCRYLLV